MPNDIANNRIVFRHAIYFYSVLCRVVERCKNDLPIINIIAI